MIECTIKRNDIIIGGCKSNMCLVQTDTIIKQIVRTMSPSNDGALQIMDEEERFRKESSSIYASDSELIYHCRDMINKLVHCKTTKEQKMIYLTQAVHVGRNMKPALKEDISILNRCIQKIVLQ